MTVAVAVIYETKAKINICQPLHNRLLVVVRLKESDRSHSIATEPFNQSAYKRQRDLNTQERDREK